MRSLFAAAVVGLLAGTSLGVIDLKVMVIDQATGQPASTATARPGTELTIGLFAQGTESGVLAVGGDIVAGGTPGMLDSSGEHFAWRVAADSVQLWTPADDPAVQNGQIIPTWDQFGSFAAKVPQPDFTTVNNMPVAFNGYTYPSHVTVAGQVAATPEDWNKGGAAGANGGMTQLGSGQWPDSQGRRDQDFARNTYELLGSYTVRVVGNGAVSLTWQEAPLAPGGIHVGYNGWYTTGGDIGDWDVTEPGPATIRTISPLMLTVVPEPGTMGLLILGGVLLARRRRQ